MDSTLQVVSDVMRTQQGRTRAYPYMTGLPVGRLKALACLEMYGPCWLRALRKRKMGFNELLALPGVRSEQSIVDALRWLLHVTATTPKYAMPKGTYPIAQWTLLPEYKDPHATHASPTRG